MTPAKLLGLEADSDICLIGVGHGRPTVFVGFLLQRLPQRGAVLLLDDVQPSSMGQAAFRPTLKPWDCVAGILEKEPGLASLSETAVTKNDSSVRAVIKG